MRVLPSLCPCCEQVVRGVFAGVGTADASRTKGMPSAVTNQPLYHWRLLSLMESFRFLVLLLGL